MRVDCWRWLYMNEGREMSSRQGKGRPAFRGEEGMELNEQHELDLYSSHWGRLYADREQRAG